LSTVGIVVLAAGRSSRFVGTSDHKLLAEINGTTVVRLSVMAALGSGVGRVVVVTGARANAVVSALDGLDLEIVHAPAFAEGMSASLKRGVDALEAADAIVVTLGDQPGLRSDAIRRVVARWRETEAAIVVPRYAGDDRQAHPVLFARSVYPELLTLGGDVGARSVIARDAGRVASAALDWNAPRDVDTIEDLRVAAAELAAAPPPQHTPESGARR
jgi:molybdenum cofactor cytidylyltransferase